LIEKISLLSRHGVLTGDMREQAFGYNFRLSDLHAAVGVGQMLRLGSILDARQKVFSFLDEKFKFFRKQECLFSDVVSPFMYVIELPSGVDKFEFIENMGSRGVPVKPYFLSVPSLPAYRKYGAVCPVADLIGAKTVALPFHHQLTCEEVNKIWAAFEEVVGI
jgi:perosamine synthetase